VNTETLNTQDTLES